MTVDEQTEVSLGTWKLCETGNRENGKRGTKLQDWKRGTGKRENGYWLWKDDQAWTADILKLKALIEGGWLPLSLLQKTPKKAQIKGNGIA